MIDIVAFSPSSMFKYAASIPTMLATIIRMKVLTITLPALLQSRIEFQIRCGILPHFAVMRLLILTVDFRINLSFRG